MGIYTMLILIGVFIISAVPAYASTSAVSSATNPSAYGDTVMFTATVAATGSESGIPSGTVTFYDGSASLGSVSIGPSGTAFITVSTLSGGTHSITVQYSGDTVYASSTSPAFTQTISQSGTHTNLETLSNPSAIGGAVTLKATVLTLTSGSSPSGNVRFYDGTALLGTAALDSFGTAVFTTAPLSGGTHSLTAVYAGDINYVASTSPVVPYTVAMSTTTLDLSSSANPSGAGQSVTFTATVKGASGRPTGTVRFNDGVTVLGTSPLDSAGRATWAASALSPGTHSITAAYSGDVSYYGSSSAALTQTVVVVTMPVAQFSASPTSGIAPLAVQFTDASPGSPTSWQWNFGDGTPNSTEMNPAHTFRNPGTYTVTLTAANADGSSTLRKAGFVTVGTPTSTPVSTPTPVVSPTPFGTPTPAATPTPVSTPEPVASPGGIPATIGMGELYERENGTGSEAPTATPAPIPLITSTPLGWSVLNTTPAIILMAYVQPDQSLLLILAVVLGLLGTVAAVYLHKRRN